MRALLLLAARLLCHHSAVAADEPLVLHVASAEQVAVHGDEGTTFFQSVEAARDQLRAMQPLPAGATVLLHEGTHQPFTLEAIDSGRHEAPIVYASAPGETAVISGGVTVPASAFKPSAAGGAAGVMSARLAPLGITAAMLGGMETGEGSMDFGECQHDKAELFFGGEAMVLARYPKAAADGSWRFLYADVPAGATGNYWFLMELGPNATKISTWSTKDAASAWLHGYWEFDWADSYRKLASATPVTVQGVQYLNISFIPDAGPSTTPHLQAVKSNARFYGVNLLSELTEPKEYYIDEDTQTLYFLPPAPITSAAIVLSANQSAAVVSLGSGTQHVHLVNLTVGYGRRQGISAPAVDFVLIQNCTVYGLGTYGIDLGGSNSAILQSEVSHTGCGGVSAHGGDGRTSSPGNVTVRANHIHHIALWKRTYQPAIRFAGSGNIYADNKVGFAPHTCMTGGGVNLSFTGNTIDTCCYESSDVGAFYVCGQGGTAFWGGRGSVVMNNSFLNIRNLDGTGVQGPSVQALYLDDQMSGWEIGHNRFVNCMAGSFIGGGRDNYIHDNYYENCDLAQHFDNRGMGWEQKLCNCTNGSTCDPAVATAIVADPKSAGYVAAYPQIKTAVLGGTDICVPVNNVIENNVYCKCKTYLDATPAAIASWHSVARNNTEVHTC